MLTDDELLLAFFGNNPEALARASGPSVFPPTDDELSKEIPKKSPEEPSMQDPAFFYKKSQAETSLDNNSPTTSAEKLNELTSSQLAVIKASLPFLINQVFKYSLGQPSGQAEANLGNMNRGDSSQSKELNNNARQGNEGPPQRGQQYFPFIAEAYAAKFTQEEAIKLVLVGSKSEQRDICYATASRTVNEYNRRIKSKGIEVPHSGRTKAELSALLKKNAVDIKRKENHFLSQKKRKH